MVDGTIASIALVSILLAQWLAHRRGRAAMPWMMAAAVLGPLPLIPLAMMHRRIFHHF
ncbi:MAG: hypothetical protein H6924_09035 [Alphaproteobacteria bacterium]|nr:hypothetical protein [Alphaproteobacteria bacterium]